jgi:hypothetical protein
MSESHEIDDRKAALISKRIGRTFEFLEHVVDDPRILDEIPDKSRLGFPDDGAPNPDIPLNAFIVTGTTPDGETVKIALGLCVCNEDRDESRGKFWLRAGQRWVCPECGRVFSFDGERIVIGESGVGMDAGEIARTTISKVELDTFPGRYGIPEAVRDMIEAGYASSRSDRLYLRMHPETWNRYYPNVSAGLIALATPARDHVSFQCHRDHPKEVVTLASESLPEEDNCRPPR